MVEEAPPVAPPVSEPQAPVQSLSPSQPSRPEEPERPAERQPPLDHPPEPCKVPLHVPMSNSMLESLPMTHISTTLTGETQLHDECTELSPTYAQAITKKLQRPLFPSPVGRRSICSIAKHPATAAKAHGSSTGDEQSFAFPFKYDGTHWQANHCATRHR